MAGSDRGDGFYYPVKWFLEQTYYYVFFGFDQCLNKQLHFWGDTTFFFVMIFFGGRG